MIITDDYVCPVKKQWAQSQTRVQRLKCSTDVKPIKITLPPIEKIREVRGFGVRLIIADWLKNAGANNITIEASAGDTIENGADFVVNSNGGTAILELGVDNNWVNLNK